MAEQPRAGIIGSDFERLVTEYNKALANGEAHPVSAIQGDGAEASPCEREQTFRRLLDAFPEPTLTRLRELKAEYDPDNVFRQNFAIEPAPSKISPIATS